MVEMTVIFQELHKQIKIINIRLVFWVEDFAWSECCLIGLVSVWAMVVAGQGGEVFDAFVVLSILIDTLLSDCPLCLQSL